MFDAKKVKNELIEWVREYFKNIFGQGVIVY